MTSSSDEKDPNSLLAPSGVHWNEARPIADCPGTHFVLVSTWSTLNSG